MIQPRLVLLLLLDGRVRRREVGGRREALASLGDEVPVGHAVPDGHDAPSAAAQDAGDGASRLGLPAARAYGGDGDDGAACGYARVARPQHREVDAGLEDEQFFDMYAISFTGITS